MQTTTHATNYNKLAHCDITDLRVCEAFELTLRSPASSIFVLQNN